jgi:6-phosphogluconolactonase
MAPASAATFVYVGNAENQDITVLELKANGDLMPVVAISGTVMRPLAVGPNKKFSQAGLSPLSSRRSGSLC